MTETKGRLSQRGNAAADLENPIWEVIRNQFDANTNPGGYINLGIAENVRLCEALAARMLTALRL
jgi:hypothetical protein